MVSIPDAFSSAVQVSVDRDRELLEAGHQGLIAQDAAFMVVAPATPVLGLDVVIEVLELSDQKLARHSAQRTDPGISTVEQSPHLAGLAANLPVLDTRLRAERLAALRDLLAAFPAECPPVGSLGECRWVTPAPLRVQSVVAHRLASNPAVAHRRPRA